VDELEFDILVFLVVGGDHGEFQIHDMLGICRCGWCFGHTQPCFFMIAWFQRGCCEAIRYVATIGRALVPR
jgi:hypothetical protein